MNPEWRGLLAIGFSVIAVAGCATARSQARPVHKPIVIDPQVGEILAPAPASARPKLTAQQAWARYMRHVGAPRHTALPSYIRVHLGLLTLPTGPGSTGPYTARNELTYGYSSPSACVTMNPRVMFPPGARCVYWDFLDASTGHQIDSTYQAVGHWHVLQRAAGSVPRRRHHTQQYLAITDLWPALAHPSVVHSRPLSAGVHALSLRRLN